MKVLDPGHHYELSTLDGDIELTLQFVKRNRPPEKYPGNVDAYPGTTTQEVLRVLMDRTRYVNRQFQASENLEVLAYLGMALAALENRAARIHGRPDTVTPYEAENGPFCKDCGHVGHSGCYGKK